jgi:hypothetical protein
MMMSVLQIILKAYLKKQENRDSAVGAVVYVRAWKIWARIPADQLWGPPKLLLN